MKTCNIYANKIYKIIVKKQMHWNLSFYIVLVANEKALKSIQHTKFILHTIGNQVFFNYYLDISQVNLRYNNETNVNTQEIRMFLCRSSTSLH